MSLNKMATRGDQKTYISVQNVDASSITQGFGAVMRLGGSMNGGAAALSRSGTAADLPGFLGVAANDIAPNDFGLVQTGGFVASIFLSHVGSSVTINIGDPLVPGAVAGSFFSGAPTYANSGFRWINASNTPVALSAAGSAAGWIKGGL